MRLTLFRRLGPIGLALLLPLGAAACSQGDQDRAEQTTDSVADDARQAGNEIGHSLDSLGEDARQRVQEAADQLRSSSKDVREATARNAVSSVAAGEFKRQGVTLDGTPTCEASSDKIGAYHVQCTGPTTDGRTASLVGDDPGDGPSNFVGSVDGQEVFRQECVGLC
jgi:hypothetical protein